jgi:hypothetical protein
VSSKNIQYVVDGLPTSISRALGPFRFLAGFGCSSQRDALSSLGLKENQFVWSGISRVAKIALFLFLAATSLHAQQASESSGASGQQNALQAPAAPATPNPKSSTNTHRFWDRENDLLFAGVAASRGMDYSSTLNLRRRGDIEILLDNSIVDNHALFAGIEASATVASIGVSYLFHRTGHHSLERWTSIIHIGVTVGGALRNYALPTRLPK